MSSKPHPVTFTVVRTGINWPSIVYDFIFLSFFYPMAGHEFLPQREQAGEAQEDVSEERLGTV